MANSIHASVEREKCRWHENRLYYIWNITIVFSGVKLANVSHYYAIQNTKKTKWALCPFTETDDVGLSQAQRTNTLFSLICEY